VIVLDGSAIFAYILDEPEADRCEQLFTSDEPFAISAACLAELLIVAGRKGVSRQAERMIASLSPEVYPVTEQRARAAAEAYGRWGKGVHPARLNIIDCFAYALALEHRCPLLFVGNDFALTDATPALS